MLDMGFMPDVERIVSMLPESANIVLQRDPSRPRSSGSPMLPAQPEGDHGLPLRLVATTIVEGLVLVADTTSARRCGD